MLNSLKYIPFVVLSLNANIGFSEDLTNQVLIVSPSISVNGTPDPQSIYDNSLHAQQAGEYLLLEGCTIRHVYFDKARDGDLFQIGVTEGSLTDAKLSAQDHSLRVSFGSHGEMRRYSGQSFDPARPTVLPVTEPDRVQEDMMWLTYDIRRGGALSLITYRALQQEITSLNDAQMNAVVQFIEDYQLELCADPSGS